MGSADDIGDGVQLGEHPPAGQRAVLLAGTYEAWPRSRPLPGSHPIRVHYGRPISPEQIKALGPEALTALIRERILECQATARGGLARLSAIEAD